MNIDDHILGLLDARAGVDQPMTMNDLARHFGISAVAVVPVARRLVDAGLAMPSTVMVNGVPTLRGLRAMPVAERSP